jgi:hypothetical protein
MYLKVSRRNKKAKGVSGFEFQVSSCHDIGICLEFRLWQVDGSFTTRYPSSNEPTAGLRGARRT